MMGDVKRDYRAVSYSLCSAVIGVIVMRIVSQYSGISADSYGLSLAADALFSLPVQLVFFFGVPFCIYKFYGRRTVKEVFDFSSCGAFKPRFLLALPLGFCAWMITLNVSSAWRAILEFTGYTYTVSSAPMPEKFNVGFFIAEIAMTAILPAVCEEFCMRGGLLTTAKRTFGKVGCIVLCGVAFGLFHQNIKQVFYTSLFGALAAYLTIEQKSIYPAVLMHFANNFTSVFIDYATEYDWAVGGGLIKSLSSMANGMAWAVLLINLCVILCAVGLVILMLYLREKKVISKKMDVIRDSAYDVTNKKVVLIGEFSDERVSELEMEKEVYGGDYKEEKYKPSARDVMIIAALFTVTLLTTVFTYVWGFFY